MRLSYEFKEAKLAFAQHELVENKGGLLVDLLVTTDHGAAELEAALQMLDEHLPGSQLSTVSEDRRNHSCTSSSAASETSLHVAMAEHHEPAG